MHRQEKNRWTIVGMLIISVLAIGGLHQLAQKSSADEMCVSKEAAEKDTHRMRSGVPMWESLSRHLISIQR